MKLAEALQMRAAAQIRLEELKERMKLNALIQEDDLPAEEPHILLEEYEETAKLLTRLIQRISATNANVKTADGSTIADTLAVRDVLRKRFNAYQDLAEAAVVRQNRYSRSEVRFVSTVDVNHLHMKADEIAREYRLLDVRIQEMNWTTDLLEE